MSGKQGSILVIRGGAIGDFILTLPAIAALRERFPAAHLEVLGYPHIAQLALAGGLVDRVQPIEARGLAGFFARDGTLAEELRDYFSDFDLIFSYLYDPDQIFQDNVRRCSPAQFIQGPHRPQEGGSLHATQVYLGPLERLAIFDAEPVPRLRIGSAAGAVTAGTGPVVAPLALHPGSGSERKNWPEAQWRDFLGRLVAKTPLPLLLVGGEAEGAKLDRLAQPLPRERVRLVRNLPLAELAGLLRECGAFVGHDSGITHLAAAVGLPCLVLWGDTAEEVWRPSGERIQLLREPHGLPALAVDRVLEETIRLVVG